MPKLPVPLGIGAFISKWLGMRVGVANINLHGRVRIAARPLLSKLPVVGGVKVKTAARYFPEQRAKELKSQGCVFLR